MNILEKRQAPTGDSACKLALTGTEPTGKLLCCEPNSACIASPPTCSSTNKLIQCWNIGGFDPCTRNDSVATNVCQHKDGTYCLEGVTDLPYSGSQGTADAINWLLSRNSVND